MLCGENRVAWLLQVSELAGRREIQKIIFLFSGSDPVIQNGGIKRSALHLPVSAQDETLLALVPLEGPTLGLRAGCVLRRALLAVEGGVIVACSI